MMSGNQSLFRVIKNVSGLVFISLVSKWFAWWNSLGLFGICGLYQRGGGIGNERERLFIETTSLMTSKTILINSVVNYATYTKQMVI